MQLGGWLIVQGAYKYQLTMFHLCMLLVTSNENCVGYKMLSCKFSVEMLKKAMVEML